MRRGVLAATTLLCLLAPSADGKKPTAQAKPEPALRLEVKAPAKPVAPGANITLEVTLSAADDGSHEFLLGALPQVFGVYVLGPWGHVMPDPMKVRPENWMHQQHSVAARIRVTKATPYRTTMKLSDYFAVTDTKQFRPGAYQVNVKFYVVGIGMRAPIDSGPARFEISEPPAK